MVVSLHACDTATDLALAKAVAWQSTVILSVPCCQHELFNKIQNPGMGPLLKHGILKERLSALITDALRAQVLEMAGYQVQVIEFIDMEHTAKNLLIRAVRKKGEHDVSREAAEYQGFYAAWGLNDLFIEKAMIPTLPIRELIAESESSSDNSLC